MRLAASDSIITAWAESCSGPGWSNRLVWVLVRDGDGRHRVEALQPSEQTEEMLWLFRASEAVSQAMTAAVERAMPKRRRKP